MTARQAMRIAGLVVVGTLLGVYAFPGLLPSWGGGDCVKVQGTWIFTTIVRTDATFLGGMGLDKGAEGKENYEVTGQIVGANVNVKEQLVVSSQGKETSSVHITTIPIRDLPRTFTLALDLPKDEGLACMEHSQITLLRVHRPSRKQVARQNFGKVGDEYSVVRDRIIAAGGKQTYIPLAPVGEAPTPVVDASGHTNWIEHEPPPLPQLFDLKDGRLITIELNGSKISGIHVAPPRETPE